VRHAAIVRVGVTGSFISALTAKLTAPVGDRRRDATGCVEFVKAWAIRTMFCHTPRSRSHCSDVSDRHTTTNTTTNTTSHSTGTGSVVVRWMTDPTRATTPTLVAVEPGEASTTVGDLADVLGVGRRGLWIDGRAVSGVVPLHDCGLVTGSAVSPWGGDDDDGPSAARWELRVVAGPDAGTSAPLAVGTTVVGRDRRRDDRRGDRCGDAGGAVRPGRVGLDDAGLAPFHATLEVTESGRDGDVHVECVPLADRLTQRCVLTEGVPVRLAESAAWVVRRGEVVARDLGAVVDGRRIVRRPPRLGPANDATGVSSTETGHEGTPFPPAGHQIGEGPAAAPPTAALIGAGVTIVVAFALRQPMLAVFGLSGVVVALATWAHARLGHRRTRRRMRFEHAAIAARLVREAQTRRTRLERHARTRTVDLCECLARIERLDARLWERRPDHADTWSVVLGLGERAVGTSGEVLHDVPVEVSVAPGTITGWAGPRDIVLGITRSVVVQLAANVGPADLAVQIVTDDLAEWAWAGWLPHVVRLDAHDPTASLPAGAPPRATLTVIDSRSPCRLDGFTPADAVIVLAEEQVELPAACTALGLATAGLVRWHADATDGLPAPVHAARLRRDRADAAAARLAGLLDPECASAGVDGAVPLADLVPDHSDAIVRAWDELGSDPPPSVPIGRSGDGIVHLDLVRDGPHALVAGTTGAGKSELLRTLVVGLAATSPPDHLSFLLVDYKGGAAFDACERLPHVVGTVTDLDAVSAQRALRSLHAELRRREHVMRRAGVSDLAGLRRLGDGSGAASLARLVVVIDEFATLAAELPDFLSALVGVAQRGRSLGVHLVLATQRPGGVITEDIRANTNLRIALRVASVAEAIDVVGDPLPASFPRDRPGRATVRLGADDLTVVQVASTQVPSRLAARGGSTEGGPPVRVVPVHDPFVATRPSLQPAETSDELDRLVDTISDAAVRRGRPAPTAPWCAPLPSVVRSTDLLQPDDHGLLDDPDEQTRRPLVWDPSTGHLLVVGAVGAGSTSTLMVVAARQCGSDGDTSHEVVVIDAVGDPRWVSAAPALAGLVRVAETERLVRLVRALHGEIVTRRRAADAATSRVVVVIDGIGAVRSALADLDHDLVDEFDRVVADGPGVGVVVAAGAPDTTSVPLGLVTRSSQRWVLRLADPLDGSLLGVHPSEVPGHRAPPGRLLAMPERLTGQVLCPTEVDWPTRSARLSFGRLDPLPESIDIRDLGAVEVEGAGVRVPLGIGWTDLEPVTVRCDAGEHLVVVGPSRSGRTTVLDHVVRAWTAADGDRVAIVVRGRAATAAAAPACLDVITSTSAADAVRALETALGDGLVPLLAVDDADRVEDPTGRLASLLASGSVASVITGRAEALRSAYGHWTTVARRSRTGLVLGRLAGTDADLFGVMVPRRVGVPDALGRGWLVVDGAPVDVVQTPGPPG
jgi:S-DNA-T family DNA segregation ATPase FtsK/SpoIIIE